MSTWRCTTRAARAAFVYLRHTAFFDMKVPACEVAVQRFKGAWGFYYVEPHKIAVDSSIKTPKQLLRVMAHEMCHAVLEQNAACDHHKHDTNFRELARIVCERMSWSTRGF